MLRLVALALLGAIAAVPSLAADLQSSSRTLHGGSSSSIDIADAQRKIIYDYYGEQIAKGICPPGLNKKNTAASRRNARKNGRSAKPSRKTSPIIPCRAISQRI